MFTFPRFPSSLQICSSSSTRHIPGAKIMIQRRKDGDLQTRWASSSRCSLFTQIVICNHLVNCRTGTYRQRITSPSVGCSSAEQHAARWRCPPYRPTPQCIGQPWPPSQLSHRGIVLMKRRRHCCRRPPGMRMEPSINAYKAHFN